MAIKKVLKSKEADPVMQLAYVVLVLCFFVLGMALFWKYLPTRPKPIAPPTPPLSQQVQCQKAGGKWIECGSPCHGSTSTVCMAMCEAQCLCGGDEGYRCPADLQCTQRISLTPSSTPIGVCRTKAYIDQKQQLDMPSAIDVTSSTSVVTSTQTSPTTTQ